MTQAIGAISLPTLGPHNDKGIGEDQNGNGL